MSLVQHLVDSYIEEVAEKEAMMGKDSTESQVALLLFLGASISDDAELSFLGKKFKIVWPDGTPPVIEDVLVALIEYYGEKAIEKEKLA